MSAALRLPDYRRRIRSRRRRVRFIANAFTTDKGGRKKKKRQKKGTEVINPPQAVP